MEYEAAPASPPAARAFAKRRKRRKESASRERTSPGNLATAKLPAAGVDRQAARGSKPLESRAVEIADRLHPYLLIPRIFRQSLPAPSPDNRPDRLMPTPEAFRPRSEKKRGRFRQMPPSTDQSHLDSELAIGQLPSTGCPFQRLSLPFLTSHVASSTNHRRLKGTAGGKGSITRS